MKYFIILLFLNLGIAQTQSEMNQEAFDSYKLADKELNEVYKELVNLLDANEKQLLIKAQRDWIKFRDSHCEYEKMQYEGGSIQPLIHYSCLADKTQNRIKDLKISISDKKR